MGFDPCNHSMKIWESIGTPTPNVGFHLGVWRFNSHTLPYFEPLGSMKCDSQASLLAPLQAFALVVSPNLGLRHWIALLDFEFKFCLEILISSQIQHYLSCHTFVFQMLLSKSFTFF
jgi:hypothetical protein